MKHNREDKYVKNLTTAYTDTARTAATTFGHSVEIIGAAMRAGGIPGGRRVGRIGEAIATQAARSCSRDTPSLVRCNHGRRNGR